MLAVLTGGPLDGEIVRVDQQTLWIRVRVGTEDGLGAVRYEFLAMQEDDAIFEYANVPA